MEIEKDLGYLKLLADQYPTIAEASTEIINLNAILNLPKGTEHFLSDIHGEDEAFLHVLKNGSGSLRRKIDQVFSNTLMETEKRTLATLIYYPKSKLKALLKGIAEPEEWYRITLFRIVRILRLVASKYTRSRVRRSLPADFAYIIEELLHEQEDTNNKVAYYQSIIDTIISTGRADAFIVALAETIQELNVDRLHIIGDIYDRGPGAHKIMDKLIAHHEVDIQWGNHDIVWMGAAAGSEACIASVIRVCLRYGNMQTLENGYGISLLPLAGFAMEVYGEDQCTGFMPQQSAEGDYTDYEKLLLARMHKAITVIQLKLEGQIIKRRPEFEMEKRLLLDKMDLAKGTVKVDGQEYPLNDTSFPTISSDDPWQLTDEEATLVEQFRNSFSVSEKLQTHVRFLYSKGSMYLVCNGNLLYHGCIAMTKEGEFKAFKLAGETYQGREFMDHVELLARQAFFSPKKSEEKSYGQDTAWYLWSGAQSPLFGKDKMGTFERYFISDKASHIENKNAYYSYRDNPETCRKILTEFGLNAQSSIIINGHVPVEVKKGESPLKADGRLLVIDGGFSKAYQPHTGIAGYTLVYNSHGIMLCAHEPFESARKAVKQEKDIHSSTCFIVRAPQRLCVRDTDKGLRIQTKIDSLQKLLKSFRNGYIKEKC